ncbi:pyruvate kinase [Cavenderia fasciculata]|uniref:Pyruvate kinase n=1 Tax=Cavenderia fasciculata TaxID=261658 RepID=F4PTP5_CACFS|nr:pyruvate kinase [Cavenderia fasciculata]EGG21715.1 pyruvate kinase [Cavenderia fasciculata]|eukprot:XP_004359565.1 pyruvate kinase [Cavenderia fasciculata]
MATLSRNLRLNIDSPTQSFVRTKIVCTIGPKTMSVEMLVKLIETGMSVCRCNFSHGTHEYHAQVIKNLREAVKITGKDCAVMLDTKGPEIRTGLLEGGEPIDLPAETEIIVDTNTALPGNKQRISVDYKGLIDSVKVGGHLLIADGVISFSILEVNKEKGFLKCKVNNNSKLGEKKNVHLPGAIVTLPAVAEKDIEDLKFGVEQKVDFVAASFIRKAEDVNEIRGILGEKGATIQIISKIENEEGIINFNDILDASDGIMVARGDLGVEVNMEKIFIAQKMMVSKCNAVGKPVITATQMLESMIKAPRPTRAECTDVANAVLDGTDCVMLSGETASGDYPLEAVDIMAKICREAELVESSTDYHTLFAALKIHTTKPISVAETVASYAVATAIDLKADLIITLTETGLTTRLVSKYRPPIPIVAVTSWEHTVKHLMSTRGTIPLLVDSLVGTDKLVEYVLEYAMKKGYCRSGSRVVIVSGVMEGVPGLIEKISKKLL